MVASASYLIHMNLSDLCSPQLPLAVQSLRLLLKVADARIAKKSQSPLHFQYYCSKSFVSRLIRMLI